MQDSLYSSIKTLQLLSVSHTQKYVNDFIENHVQPISLLCLSDLFETYQLETTAGEFDDKQELLNYPGLHISQLKIDGSLMFVIVEDVSVETIIYYQDQKKITEPLLDYFKKWTGYVLFVKKTKEAIEPNYKTNKQQQIIEKIKPTILIAIGAVLLYSILLVANPIIHIIPFYGLMTLQLMGLTTSVLLLSITLKNTSSFAKSVCKLGDEYGCATILHAKASKIFSFLNWSEVGFFYFAISLTSLFIAEIFQIDSIYFVLFFLNIFALPYSFYSVYYQKFIAKQWCTLCLLVQGILWLQFVLGILYYKNYTSDNLINPIALIIFSTLVIVPIWYLLKPMLEAHAEIQSVKKSFQKFKTNPTILTNLLNQERSIAYPSPADVLKVGTENPKIVFTVFSSPSCAHCSHAYLEIEKLKNLYSDDISISEIFAVSENGTTESKNVAIHTLRIAIEQGSDIAHQAMLDWHQTEFKDAEKWANKFHVASNNTNQATELLSFHGEICNRMNIHSTPTIVINQKVLPELFTYRDLATIIPVLILEYKK